MMRWKGIITFGSLSIILSILSYFFSADMVKSGIQTAGSLIVGAKVEVEQVELSLWNLSLNIRGLQVADPDDEWRNLFETQDIKFQIDLEPLLEKKIAIEQMTLEGVRFATVRQTSGKLPPSRSKLIQTASGFWKQGNNLLTQELASLPALQAFDGPEQVNIDELYKPDQLKSPVEIKKTREALIQKDQSWQKIMTDFNVTSELNQIQQQIDTVDLKTKDPKKIKKELDKLKDIKNSLKQVKNQADNTRQQFQTDLDFMNNALARIEQVKKEDHQNMIKAIDIKNINQEDMARIVFGPVWLDRTQKWLYWLDKIRRFMPEPKAKTDKEERIRGMNVSFTRQNGYPDFLIKRALLSTAGKSAKASDYTFQGELAGVSSDPAIYGQPCLITAQGTRPPFELKGTLDHTGEISHDNLELKLTAVALDDFTLTKSPLLPEKIAKGQADVLINLLAQGDNLELKITVLPTHLSFAAEDIPQGALAKEIANILTTTQDLRIDGEITGHKNKLNFKITSNIDEILSGQIKNMLLARVENTKQQLRDKLNQQVDQQQSELLKDFQAKKSALESQIQEKTRSITQTDDLIDKRIDKIKKNATKGLFDKFKK
ncbi:TIGR03545 family protein [Planctomycetota bacterium]